MEHSNILKKVVISGGGTGGHIFPAISIANEIERRYPKCRILFVGAHGRMEADKVPAAGYEILLLNVEGMSRGKNPFKHFKTLYKLLKSYLSIRRELKRFRPDITIGVGGYASAPTLLAAQSLGIPTLIQEQNSYAGVTNKLVGKRAKAICVAYPGMERFFKKKVPILLTGNPVRSDLFDVAPKAEEAYAYFGLEQEKKTLLILGGSLGARTINQSTAEALLQFVEHEGELQVVWQCGSYYYDEMAYKLKELGIEEKNIYLYEFIKRMDYAYAVADVVVSRAGAGSISEFSLLGKAVVLVPSPNVAEDHQTKNAEALSTRGAALLVKDSEAVEHLMPTALALIDNESEREALSANIRQLALPHAAEKIVDEVERIVSTNSK